MRLTSRAICYLRAIDDWKAPFEVAAILGDTTPKIARSTLFALVGGGFAKHGPANDTFRITDSGRAALSDTSQDRRRR